MSAAEWVQAILGPVGALVFAATATIVLVRELRKRAAEELARLEQALAGRVEECQALAAKLEAEHAGRLDDARRTTETLLSLTDRIHQTLDKLESLARKQSP